MSVGAKKGRRRAAKRRAAMEEATVGGASVDEARGHEATVDEATAHKAAMRMAKEKNAQEKLARKAAKEQKLAKRAAREEKLARRAAKQQQQAAEIEAVDQEDEAIAWEKEKAERRAAKEAASAPVPPDAVERLVAIRRENLVSASHPMVLIAQTPRSGGTLLSQLVDGHPELHTHPGELKIGPAWPSLDVGDPPQVWWKALQPKNLFHAFRDGYSKARPAQKLGHHEQLETFPFMLPPSLYGDLFMELAADRAIESQRDVLDLHFTALFNAWLDNQNLYGGPKRWILAFRGKLRTPENLAKFFADYPDGRHITCVRDPKAKLASKLVYATGRAGDGVEVDRDDPEGDESETDDLPKRIRSWRAATEMQIQAKERYGDQVFLLTFENLVTETEQTMRAMAEWMGIEFDPILTLPTFNRFPIKANSSYRVAGHGVRRETLENWRSVFTDEQAEEIETGTRDLQERVHELASNT
jgi:hypothetical protein